MKHRGHTREATGKQQGNPGHNPEVNPEQTGWVRVTSDANPFSGDFKGIRTLPIPFAHQCGRASAIVRRGAKRPCNGEITGKGKKPGRTSGGVDQVETDLGPSISTQGGVGRIAFRSSNLRSEATQGATARGFGGRPARQRGLSTPGGYSSLRLRQPLLQSGNAGAARALEGLPKGRFLKPAVKTANSIKDLAFPITRLQRHIIELVKNPILFVIFDYSALSSDSSESSPTHRLSFQKVAL